MGNEEPCGFCCRLCLEVLGEATAPSRPCESPLDDPSARQELEALDAVRSLDDVDRPRPAMREGTDQLWTAIDAIGEDMPQLGKAPTQILQQRNRAMDILHIGGMNMNREQKTIGVGHDVPLTSMNAFAGVEAAWPAGLRCGGALAVNDRSAGLGPAPQLVARLAHQSPDDPAPKAGIPPSIKIALNCRVRRELARQSPPLAAGTYKIAWTTSRRSTWRGRPMRRGGGSRRAISRHSASVMSLA